MFRYRDRMDTWTYTDMCSGTGTGWTPGHTQIGVQVQGGHLDIHRHVFRYRDRMDTWTYTDRCSGTGWTPGHTQIGVQVQGQGGHLDIHR